MDSVTIKALRRAWVHSNGLGGSADSARSAVRKAGWLHAIAGVDPYLSIRSRYSAVEKGDVDALLADDTVRIVTAARGCRMLVPDEQCALALSLSLLVTGRELERNRQKLGVSDGEIERAASIVIALLKEEPLSNREIRKKVPEGALRSLGSVGKKMGYPSTLPMVMSHLEYGGKIGRWAEGDRLDNERYRWDLLDLEVEVSRDSESVVRRSIAHYLDFAGASTIADFSAWSGVEKRESKEGFESLDLHPFRVDGRDVVVYAKQATAEFLLGGVPRVPKTVIVPFMEPLIDHRDGYSLLLDSEHHHLKSRAWGHGKKSLVEVNNSGLRSIFVEGAIGGFWDYDEETQEIQYALFNQMRGGDLRDLEADLEELAMWLFNTFGHAKVNQLDSIGVRKARLDCVSALIS
jgi:hypothetical protein